MAAVLACGQGACLSHRSAGALFGICEERNGVVEVSATELPSKYLAWAVNEAHKLEMIDAEALRLELDTHAGQVGVKRLCALLDRDTFVLTEEELERLFLPLAREAGLPLPKTKEIVNGYESHTAAGYVRLRFTHDQVKYEPAHVRRVLTDTAKRHTVDVP